MKAFSFVPDTQYRYFYEQLTDNEKVAYDRLLRGYFEQASRITVDTSDTGTVWRIFDKLNNRISQPTPENTTIGREVFTFAALPENLAQMQALPEAALDTPYKARR